MALEYDLHSGWELTLRLPPVKRLMSSLFVERATDDAVRQMADLIVHGGLWVKVSGHPEDGVPASDGLAEVNGAELATGAKYLVAYGAGGDPLSARLFSAANGLGVTIASVTPPGSRCRVRLELGGSASDPHLAATAIGAFASVFVTLHAPPVLSDSGTGGATASAASVSSRLHIPQQLQLLSSASAPSRLQSNATTAPTAQAWQWVSDLDRLLHAARVATAHNPDTSTVGPRVLICGSGRGTGKTTACKTLCNYAVRSKYHPLLVSASLDGTLGPAPPGCLSAGVVQHTLPVEDGSLFLPAVHVVVPFGSSLLQRSDVFHGGEALMPPTPASVLTSTEGRAAYKAALSALMDVADQRALMHARCRCAGVIVDAPADDGSDEFCQVLVDIISIVGISTVVFVGHSARLRARLRNALLLHDDGNGEMGSGLLYPSLEKGTATSDVVIAASKRLLSAAHTSASLPVTGERIQLLQVPPVPGARRIPVLSDVDRAQWAIAAAWRGAFFGTVSSRLHPVTVTVPLSRLLLTSVGVRSDERLQGLLPMADERSGAGPTGPQVECKVLYSLADLVDAVTGLHDDESHLEASSTALRGSVIGLSSLDPTDGNGSVLDRVSELLCVCGFGIIVRVVAVEEAQQPTGKRTPPIALELLLVPDRVPALEAADAGTQCVAIVMHQRVQLNRVAAS